MNRTKIIVLSIGFSSFLISLILVTSCSQRVTLPTAPPSPGSVQSNTPTHTSTGTPTAIASSTSTMTSTSTGTPIPDPGTFTRTPTVDGTPTATITFTMTATTSFTPPLFYTATLKPSGTPTQTPTPTMTFPPGTHTPTPVFTATYTISYTNTVTMTPTTTFTPTWTGTLPTSTFTLTQTSTPTFLCTTPLGNLGDSTAGSTMTYDIYKIHFVQAVLSQDGVVDHLMVYLQNCDAMVAIYTDNNGQPGALLVQSNSTRGNGLTPVLVPPTVLSAGTYWLALQADGYFREKYSATYTGWLENPWAYGPFPPTVTFGNQVTTGEPDLYAPYCPLNGTPTVTATPTPVGTWFTPTPIFTITQTVTPTPT